MKDKKWIYLMLIVLCIAVFFGYRSFDRVRTDSRAPEISVGTQQLQVSVHDPEELLLQGVTARDNRDADVTDSLVVENVRLLQADGTAVVTYAAFDRSGNVAKAQREILYTDYESPRFTLNRSLTFAHGTGFDIMDVVGARDLLDGDISHRVRATAMDDVAISNQGIHDVQFRVTNTLGQTVELTLPVEVYASGLYDARVTLTDYLVYLDAGAAFHPNQYLDSFALGSEKTELARGIPEELTVRITGEVDTGVPGVYPVAYKISMIRGTNVFTGYAKLIVVVEG